MNDDDKQVLGKGNRLVDELNKDYLAPYHLWIYAIEHGRILFAFSNNKTLYNQPLTEFLDNEPSENASIAIRAALNEG